ncbi:MAG: prepilin-type N-terminal cleavage/methylation domain-containing protein [Phycisphaerales bacterium]|nr:MAG: prepilin-type N-terminal cleavage/methylation domain-containing protein [Phycisphaerales bacterium]
MSAGLHNKGKTSLGRPAFRGRGGARAARGSGFSLVELMIAIVILGFGMIMVATLFPVGWDRARKLSEHTTRQTVMGNTHALMTLMARVDGLSKVGSSFPGDMIVEKSTGTYPVTIYYFSDTRVHALNMENLLVQSRAFVPESDPNNLHRQDLVVPFANPADLQQGYDALFIHPQIDFEDRVYPPLRRRISQSFSTPDPLWDEALDDRRFAVAILHRMREQIGPSRSLGTPYAQLAQTAFKDANKTRTIDIYYVTLRRTQSTFRYAQQDIGSSSMPRVPDPSDRFAPVPVRARTTAFDVLLPVPWRVQVAFIATGMSDVPANASGIPSQVAINAAAFFGGQEVDYLVDVFQEETLFIEEITGEVFRVVNRQLLSSDSSDNLDQAILTLDRELTIADLDDGELPGNGVLEADERLRTVWVFPPAVEPRDSASLELVFASGPPVVSIDVRTLAIAP